MDPLSITAGVAGILSATLSVGVMLRKFLHGAKEASAIVNAMISDVKALRKVLESMEASFDEMDSDRLETGHIGTHWQNLLASLQDGQGSLLKLEKLLQDAAKEVKILDATRRQARLQLATEQIGYYRQEVQTYKDALQLSLQTITFYNQTMLQRDTSRLIESSETIQLDIQRLAINLDVKLVALETAVQARNLPDQMTSINNLKATIGSAATVISGSNSVLSTADEDEYMTDYMSEFGDWFRSETALTTLEWIRSDRTNRPLSDPSSTISRDQDLISSAEFQLRNSVLIPHTTNSYVETFNSWTQQEAVIQQTQQSSAPTQPITLLTPSSQSEFTGDSGKRNRSSLRRLSVRNILRMSKREDATTERMKVGSQSKPAIVPARLKIVSVGDGACGKTCFIIRTSKGTMPEVYVPTVFENYVMDLNFKGSICELGLWDSAGQEDYDRLRPLSYPNSDVILICFAIDNPQSFDNVQEKWISEILHFQPSTPILLVGMKADLRNDPATIGELLLSGLGHPVTWEEAEKVRKKIGAVEYVECSAKTGKGCEEVMMAAVEAVLSSERRQDDADKRQSKGLFSRLFRA